jgi:hypothetical protein
MTADNIQKITPRQTIVICKMCGWPWIPRQIYPLSCPHCWSEDWDSEQRLDKALISGLKREYFLRDNSTNIKGFSYD